MKKSFKKITKMAAVFACVMAMLGSVLSVSAQTVKTNDTVRMRKGAGTDTDVVTSVPSGSEMESSGTEDGSDGKTWYKVNYKGSDGYIRGDFIEEVKSEEPEEEEESESEEGSSNSLQIGGENANVRDSASTDGSVVATAESGDSFDIKSEVTDDEGNTWYEIEVDGTSGYVNANDVVVGGQEAPEEAAPVDMGSTEISNVISSRILPGDVDLTGMTIDEATLNEWASGNYYVLYTTDNKGGDSWYLYSLSDSQFEKIADLHADNTEPKEEAKGGVSKVVVIVLVVIIIALIVALVVVILKGRNGGSSRKSYSYDNDDEDDEYDDEEYDDEDEYDDEEEEEEEEDYEPAPKKRGLFGRKKASRDYDDEDDYEDDEYDDDDDYEDDDFEFDFLNMDK